MSLESPGFIGRYVVFDELASGGMATVYLGRSLDQPERIVALKRLHPHFAKDKDFATMFMDEARLALRLDHRNIVQTLDVVPVGGELVIVLEYVHGAALATLVGSTRKSRRRLPVPIAVGVVVGMLRGLHAAHEARSETGEFLGVVHRDVSPQNVLVGVDGAARLIDFGIAKAVGRMHATREGALKGKLAYMAPEQARGDELTRRADLFPTAIVLWEALTGQGLFRSKNEAELLMKVLTQPVTSPRLFVPDLPEALDAVVMRGLERDPAARFATAREMADALEEGAGGVATPEEIGAWVATEAREALAERAPLLEGSRLAVSTPEKLAALRAAAAEADAKLPPVGEPRRAPLPADDVDDEAETRQLMRTPVSSQRPRPQAESVAPSSARAARHAPPRAHEPTPEERKRAALNARAGFTGAIGAPPEAPRAFEAAPVRPLPPLDASLPMRIPPAHRRRADDDSLVSRLAAPAALAAAAVVVAVLDSVFREQTASWSFRPGWLASALFLGGLLLGGFRALSARR
jgi:serine/threonine-protein kinase